MENVSLEIAQKDINAWLDSKRISEKKRKDNEKVVDNLVSAVMEGNLVWDEEQKLLKQRLQWPVGENEELKHIEFKQRITQGDISARLRTAKSDDAFAVMGVYISAITGQPIAILDKLDSSDYSIAQSVAVFFM